MSDISTSITTPSDHKQALHFGSSLAVLRNALTTGFSSSGLRADTQIWFSRLTSGQRVSPSTSKHPQYKLRDSPTQPTCPHKQRITGVASPNHSFDLEGELQSSDPPAKRSRYDPPRDDTLHEVEASAMELSYDDDNEFENSSNEEAELVADDMTQQSGTSSVVHEIPSFSIDDKIEEL